MADGQDAYGAICTLARALPDDKLTDLHNHAKRLAGHRGPIVQTATGRGWRPDDPRVEEVCDEDIAVAISRLCRFGGHIAPRFDIYSVAEHSVRVCRLVREWGADPAIQLQALVHDAHEAYPPGDVIATVKHHSPNAEGMKRMEKMAAKVVRAHFGVPVDLAPVVREADLALLHTEKRDLLVESDITWVAMPDPIAEVIEPWSTRRAHDEWRTELLGLRADLLAAVAINGRRLGERMEVGGG